MASPGWWRRRERWAATAAAAGPIVCAVCDAPWRVTRDDLHHRSYDRLGHELDEDLVALCRGCHEELHQLIDRYAAWRRLPRAMATDQIIAALRRQPRRRDPL